MQEQANGEVARGEMSRAAAELQRAHPEIFAVAEDIIRRARKPAGRAQAVWFHDGEWLCGPVDGKLFALRHKKSIVAGVYTRDSRPIEVVTDMFAAMGAIS